MILVLMVHLFSVNLHINLKSTTLFDISLLVILQ